MRYRTQQYLATGALLMALGLLGGLLVGGLVAIAAPPPAPIVSTTAAAEPTPADAVRLAELHLVGPLYEVWIDPEAKLATRLRCEVLAAETRHTQPTDRRWFTPRELEPWLLEDPDYTGSGYDRGHLRPLAWSWGSPAWRSVNHLANIVPQAPATNRGAIRALEAEVARLARQLGSVQVEIEIRYERNLPPLTQADEAHQIPSAFVYTITPPAGEVITRVIEQEAPADD